MASLLSLSTVVETLPYVTDHEMSSSDTTCISIDFLLSFIFLSDPNMPEIDLAFAISATSASSNQSYALMQNTIKQLIDTYGVDKIHYSLIVYGASVVRVVNFNNSFPISASDLKAAIDAQPPLSGGPVLTDALQEAFRVFNKTEVRPNAKKVLVVMPDANSGAADNSLSAAVKPVEDIGVLVLSVAVGSGVDRNELSVISPNPNDVISASLNENPSVVAGNIIDRILNRKEKMSYNSLLINMVEQFLLVTVASNIMCVSHACSSLLHVTFVNKNC